MRPISWLSRLLVPGVLLLGLCFVAPVKANDTVEDEDVTVVSDDGASSDVDQFVSADKSKKSGKKATAGKGKKGGKKGIKGKGKKGKGKKGKGKKGKGKKSV